MPTANALAKKAAEAACAADDRSAQLDAALRGASHSALQNAYAGYFIEWRGEFDAAVAENRRLTAACCRLQLTLFTEV